MSFAFALLAAVAAVAYEAYVKARPDASWLALLPVGMTLALTVNYGIYRLLHSESSIIGALVVFSLCTAALRVGVTLARGDHVPASVWAAFGLVVLASLLKAVWK